MSNQTKLSDFFSKSALNLAVTALLDDKLPNTHCHQSYLDVVKVRPGVGDEVDSDFSIDENDDPKSDPEDEETARKKVKVCRLSNSIISDFLTFLSPEERGCSD